MRNIERVKHKILQLDIKMEWLKKGETPKGSLTPTQFTCKWTLFGSIEVPNHSGGGVYIYINPISPNDRNRVVGDSKSTRTTNFAYIEQVFLINLGGGEGFGCKPSYVWLLKGGWGLKPWWSLEGSCPRGVSKPQL